MLKILLQIIKNINIKLEDFIKISKLTTYLKYVQFQSTFYIIIN